jgi:hypothetical protein
VKLTAGRAHVIENHIVIRTGSFLEVHACGLARGDVIPLFDVDFCQKIRSLSGFILRR